MLNARKPTRWNRSALEGGITHIAVLLASSLMPLRDSSESVWQVVPYRTGQIGDSRVTGV